MNKNEPPKQHRMMKRVVVIAVVSLGAVILYAFVDAPQRGGGETPGGDAFAQIADIELETLTGERVRLSDYAGQPLVLNAWAAWCPFCKNELPDFAAVQEEFMGDVLFIAINRGESSATVRAFTHEYGVTDRLLFLQDANDSFYDAIGGFSMPETLFYDAAGNLVEHKRGPLNEEQTRQRVERIMHTAS